MSTVRPPAVSFAARLEPYRGVINGAWRIQELLPRALINDDRREHDSDAVVTLLDSRRLLSVN